ncbi:hypothetical protein MTR67_023588 [Solanum verrucosum]|uniref:Uncharacterized protein n=1 Tax=Solanum verrucosum TaxID=315347 RepID=A0AAF0TYP1_SOLVR|nr:hypothetical protein MTR67_023588 [Solanum verrucosum]
MSLEKSGMIRVNSIRNHESASKDLSLVQKSNDSITQIERSMKAISGEIIIKSPDVRPQVRPSFDEINETSTTGQSSPGQGVHLTEILDHFDGEISGDIKSRKVTGAPVSNGNEGSHQMTPCAEDNLRKGNQETPAKGTQATQRANDEDQTGTSNDKQHGKGEKTNINANTMQQSKDHGGEQPINTNKEKAGKFVNFAHNDANHNDTPKNKLHSGQNELGKGQVVVQAAGNKANGQAGKLTHKSHDIDPKIPHHPSNKALYLDSATMQKTRGSVAKGHVLGECPVKERDEVIKQRKELEAKKKGYEKQTNQNSKSNQQHEEGKEKVQSNRQNNASRRTEVVVTHKEEQWQIQTRKKNKNNQQNQDQGMNSKTPVIEIEESGDQTPIPPSLVIIDVDDLCVENEGNLWGGNSHVLHENQMADHRNNLPTPATTTNAAQQHQKQVHQSTEEGSQQVETPKSKNKPSKKKREAIKKKQVEQHHQEQTQNDNNKEGVNPCKKFIVVEQVMDMIPLKAQYSTPTPGKPPDQAKVTVRDEYEVENSEDEIEENNPLDNAQDEDDETSTRNCDQQITREINHTEAPDTYIKTFVYAKCKEYLRKPLWDKLLHFADTRDATPWCTVGDFNVITNTDEKLGGIPYNMKKSIEFIGVIEACGLMDLGFNGPRFTWSNQRGINFRIWKRLDRAMVNDRWLQIMPHTNITHLPSVGSDHCPLLMEMNVRPENHIKYFRFLNCWADQPAFVETVTNCWNRPIEGHPMWTFHQKMKRLASTLSAWSKMQFGDIYAKVKDYEERVRVAEEDLIHNNTEEQRTKLHGINAEYIKFMKLEDSILKQKTQLQWFKEGDGNSKYFHALIRGRRRRLFIHKILKDNDEWVQGDYHIAQAACEHFQNIFTGEEKLIDEIPMDYIPRMVTQEQNDRMME